MFVVVSSQELRELGCWGSILSKRKLDELEGVYLQPSFLWSISAREAGEIGLLKRMSTIFAGDDVLLAGFIYCQCSSFDHFGFGTDYSCPVGRRIGSHFRHNRAPSDWEERR